MSVPLGWPSADGAGSPGHRDRRPGYTPGWPLDPHRLLPVEPTTRAGAWSVSASLAWRALCLPADAQMLPGWRTPRRSHWPQLRWDPGPLPQHAGRGPPSHEPRVPGGQVLCVGSASREIGRWRGAATALPRGQVAAAAPLSRVDGALGPYGAAHRDAPMVSGCAVAGARLLRSGHRDAAPLAAVELGLLYERRWRRGGAARARTLFHFAINSGHAKAAPLAEIHLRGLNRRTRRGMPRAPRRATASQAKRAQD
jgi:hypothetical protein